MPYDAQFDVDALSRLVRKNDEYLVKLDRMRDNLIQEEGASRSLWTRLADSNQQVRALRDELDAQNRKVLAVEEINTGLSRKVTELEVVVRNQAGTISAYREISLRDAAKIRELETQIESKDGTLRGYNQICTTHAENVDRLEDQIGKLENRIRCLEGLVHSTEEALRQQTENNVDLRGQVAGLELALKDARSRGEGYAAQCRNLTRVLKMAKARIATLSGGEKPESNLAAVTRVLDAVGDRPFSMVEVGFGLWNMLYAWCNSTIPVLQVRGSGRVELVPLPVGQLPLNLIHDGNPLNYGVRVEV